MKIKLFVTGVFLLASLAGAPRVFAFTVSTDAATYTVPATVYFSTSATTQINVYIGQGAAPIANTAGTVAAVATTTLNSYGWASGSFNGLTAGNYQVVVVTSVSCAGTSYAACIAANTGANIAEADFTIGAPAVDTQATSTLDQTQRNFSTAVWLFLASMFGMIYLIRKH